MVKKLAPYRKALAGLAGVALTYASLYYGTNHWVALAIAVGAVAGVYTAPNEQKQKQEKPSLPP